MDDDLNDDLLGAGGFPTDDEADLPLDGDLDLDPEMRSMKFDEDEKTPDDDFH